MTDTARLDAWARAEICAFRRAGKTRPAIRKLVKKKDGSMVTLRSIDRTLAKKRKKPRWRGTDSSAGGRPPSLTKEQRKRLVKLVFAERGKAVVTAPYCRKRLPFLRKVCEQTVRNALSAAGLAWLRRRRKAAVPAKHKPARILYSKWLLAQRPSELKRFAYTDGTSFYLARGTQEHADKKRAALGSQVWRMATGKDGLWDENVGPSLYAKAQGKPVKIWGVFAGGVLHYHVLPMDTAQKTTNMNTKRYGALVKTKFAAWRKSIFRSRRIRPHLVQDHEKCLWKKENLTALSNAGYHVVKNFPKCSPDLNAIEGWWRQLRLRLDKTSPSECETRADFLRRLRRTATWMNIHRRCVGRGLCSNQKVRAAEVLKLKGAKSKW